MKNTDQGPSSALSYRDAGVDIDAGDQLVERIKPIAARTRRPGILGGIGGFGALFEVPLDRYRQPVLVSGTDGVGTKLKLAMQLRKHDTIGIDLVAMCANDIVVQGAEPLFFLDYYATGKLDVDTAAAVVAGIGRGCELAGAALVGGETAEMPGMYHGGDYDLAGFCVGVVEKDRIIDGSGVRPGDVLLGLASSGPHSNGYSLIRRIVERSGLAWDAASPFSDGQTLAQALLEPTRIYVKSGLPPIRAGHIKALAHITGGGLIENPPRVVPNHLAVEIDAARWTLPAVFGWLMRQGHVAPEEMARTFNCGIGMVVVAAPAHADAAQAGLAAGGETVHRIGRITERRPGEPGARVLNMDSAWRR